MASFLPRRIRRIIIRRRHRRQATAQVRWGLAYIKQTYGHGA